jgi:hypothetical protein
MAGQRPEGRQRAHATAAHRRAARGDVAHAHLGVEPADRIDEAGGGSGVQAVLVVKGELDRGRGPVSANCGRLLSRGRRAGAQERGLDLGSPPGVCGHFVQTGAGGSEDDGRDQPFHQRRLRQHDRRVGGVAAEVERKLGAEDSAPEHAVVESGGDRDRRRRTPDHLQRQLDGRLGQLTAVGDDDDPDHVGFLVGVLCGSHGVVANAAAADWSSNAAEVAPGSWWPALRSPR